MRISELEENLKSFLQKSLKKICIIKCSLKSKGYGTTERVLKGYEEWSKKV